MKIEEVEAEAREDGGTRSQACLKVNASNRICKL